MTEDVDKTYYNCNVPRQVKTLSLSFKICAWNFWILCIRHEIFSKAFQKIWTLTQSLNGIIFVVWKINTKGKFPSDTFPASMSQRELIKLVSRKTISKTKLKTHNLTEKQYADGFAERFLKIRNKKCGKIHVFQVGENCFH